VKRMVSFVCLMLALTAFLVPIASCTRDRGTNVILMNQSSDALHSVVVHVTGNSYSVGELEPDKAKSVKVNPTGESHIEIEHVGIDGTAKRLYADCYIEKGYGGSIEINMTADAITKLNHHRRSLWTN
jgi:hypothetical protein